MKSTILRIIWLIPLIFLWLFFVAMTSFILIYAEGIRMVNRIEIFVVFDLLLLLYLVFQTIRFYKWIKEGKI